MHSILRRFIVATLALALFTPWPGKAQAACSIQITPSKTFSSSAQEGNLTVDVSSEDCVWEVLSYPSWITYIFD